MKKILYIFIITLLSCNSKSDLKENKEIEPEIPESVFEEPVYKEPKITGGKYFDYDELIHYKNKIEEKQISEIRRKNNKSELDSLKLGVVSDNIPKSLSDTAFISKLEELGYSKAKINENKFNEIDKIFTQKEHEEIYALSCMPMYRDILIFKRKSKIIGIVKICFECSVSEIFGTEANTRGFGMSGDFDKLYKILNEK